jgi:hypothetical protein
MLVDVYSIIEVVIVKVNSMGTSVIEVGSHAQHDNNCYKAMPGEVIFSNGYDTRPYVPQSKVRIHHQH